MAKTLKDRIENLEQKHRIIAGNVIDAIWVVDAETLKFEYVSPSIETISGYTPDEIMNLKVEEIQFQEETVQINPELKKKLNR